MSIASPDSIYVLLDHRSGHLSIASLECLAFGQQLAQATGKTLHALLLGNDLTVLADKLSRYDIASVLLIEDEHLTAFDPDPYCAALHQILLADAPHLLLCAHSYQNIDLLPKLAVRLKTALVTDCVGFRGDGTELLFTRQMFRSKLFADVRMNSRHPWLVSVQSGAYSADNLTAGQATIITRTVDLSSIQPRRSSLGEAHAAEEKIDLTKTEIIVAVGRGIGQAEHMEIIRELASVLGAEIGASRPVVDNDWVERSRQIGSSGQTVAPRLYLSCGISGAVQHLVGMKGAKCIVAIDKDQHAPIFNVATYGLVGDLFELVPAITRALKQHSESK